MTGEMETNDQDQYGLIPLSAIEIFKKLQEDDVDSADSQEKRP